MNFEVFQTMIGGIMTSRLQSSLLILGLLAFSGSSVLAQSFPSKPIRFVVAAPAGGQSDITARLIGSELTKRVGQSVLVENRPGSPTIGGGAVAKAAPDGYTYFIGGANALTSTFQKSNFIDVPREFSPVSNILVGSYFFLISSKVPVTTLKDLIAYSKVNSGKLNFGIPGTNVPDLIMKVISDRTGLDYVAIPYKGSTQVIPAMMTGEVAITINSFAAYRNAIQDGSVRSLFVTTEKRSSIVPSVPTAIELEVKDIQIGFQNGIWAPAGTPLDIRQKLSGLVAEIVKLPEVSALIRASAGADPDGSTPEEQLRKFDAENRFWIEAARIAKYEPQ